MHDNVISRGVALSNQTKVCMPRWTLTQGLNIELGQQYMTSYHHYAQHILFTYFYWHSTFSEHTHWYARLQPLLGIWSPAIGSRQSFDGQWLATGSRQSLAGPWLKPTCWLLAQEQSLAGLWLKTACWLLAQDKALLALAQDDAERTFEQTCCHPLEKWDFCTRLISPILSLYLSLSIYIYI